MHTIAIRSLIDNQYLLKTAHTKYDLQDIKSCRLLKFGGSNDIFLLESEKRKLILKIFFARQCWDYSESHYLFELELQQHLNQNGIAASKPITNKLGKLVDKIVLAEGERFFAVYEFNNGKKWDHATITDQRLYKLGRILAKFHQLSPILTGSEQRKLDINLMLDKSWNSIDSLIKLPSISIKRKLYEIYIEIKQQAQNLIKNPELVLIHGDTHCGNHLYNSKTDTITLIDFELCSYGMVNYELSVLKHDLINNRHKSTFINKVMEQFLNGYASASSNYVDLKQINFFVKARYFFMLGASFLFYPDKTEFNNEYILNNFIKAIHKANKLD